MIETNLLLAIAAAQGLLVGIVSIEAARHAGRRGLAQAAFAGAALSFVLSFVFSTPAPAGIKMMFDAHLVGAIAFPLATLAVAFKYGDYVARSIENQLKMAPRVFNYVTRILNCYNEDLTTAHLHLTLETSTFMSAGEQEIVEHIIRHMPDIGHVSDTIVVTAGAMHHGGGVIPVYAINDNDIATYEARLKVKYAAWLPKS